jgi:hypothetical protein
MTDDDIVPLMGGLSYELAVEQVKVWTANHIDLTAFGLRDDMDTDRMVRAYVNYARFKHEKPTGAGFLEALKECTK